MQNRVDSHSVHSYYSYFFLLLSEDVIAEPVPQPHSRTLKQTVQLDQTRKDSKFEVSRGHQSHDTVSRPMHDRLLCVSGERTDDYTAAASTDNLKGQSNDGKFDSPKALASIASSPQKARCM